MTILPKWFQFGFLGLAGAGIGYVLVMHTLQRSTTEDLLALNDSSLQEIELFPTGGYGLDVPISEWRWIRSTLEGSDRVYFSGWRGEQWTRYCRLLLRTKDSDMAFLLDLRSRPSMDGDVIYELQRGDESSQWVYHSYNGNALLGQLQSRYPGKCDGREDE